MLNKKILSPENYNDMLKKITEEIEKVDFAVKASYPNKLDLTKSVYASK